jgi:transposase-like protein
MLERRCPDCQSKDFRFRQRYMTKQNGTRILFMCRSCKKSFSETSHTAAARVTTGLSKVAQVLRARSEGLGFNACARTFEIARDTLRSWEQKFAELKRVLYLYALCHDFLSQVIEGDEVYTRIHHNTEASDSEGWTIVLMERASRFVWHMECGRKDKRLFKRAIKTLADVAKRTKQTTLITDGEKCYGTTLFEVCSEVLKTGKQGRPKKHYPRACVLPARTRAQGMGNVDANLKNINDHVVNIQRPTRISM